MIITQVTGSTEGDTSSGKKRTLWYPVSDCPLLDY